VLHLVVPSPSFGPFVYSDTVSTWSLPPPSLYLSSYPSLIVIGFISSYKDGSGFEKAAPAKASVPIPARILGNSSSVRGFFLNDFMPLWKQHISMLASAVADGTFV